MTFEDCATAYVEAHRPSWRGVRHAEAWGASLANHAAMLGRLPVQAIDLPLILKVLEPIWSAKPNTAARVRARIERVLDWATVRGFRKGDNPARWTGHLDHLLPGQGAVKVRHHAALPYAEVAGFVAALARAAGDERPGIRVPDPHGGPDKRGPERDLGRARRPALDLDDSGRAHEGGARASGAAIGSRPGIVLEMEKIREPGAFIFPGAASGDAYSNTALLMLLRRMGRGDLTAHGFRSTFRDWAAECTNFPGEVAEMALAHTIGDKVEAAYRRGDLFEKRRRLMQAWAKWCSNSAARGRGRARWRSRTAKKAGPRRGSLAAALGVDNE